MSDKSSGILTVKSASMGNIVVQPETAASDLMEQANLVVFPFRMNQKNRSIAVEWAASTHTPIFCHKWDIPLLVEEGFGAYRFHSLDGFREVDFQGGSIDFFPALRSKSRNLKGLFVEVLEWLGIAKANSFHFAVRPKNEKPILFLAGDEFEMTEWQVISRGGYDSVFGMNLASKKFDWKSVTKEIGYAVSPVNEQSLLSTTKINQRVKSRGIADTEGPGLDGEAATTQESWSGSKAGAF